MLDGCPQIDLTVICRHFGARADCSRASGGAPASRQTRSRAQPCGTAPNIAGGAGSAPGPLQARPVPGEVQNGSEFITAVFLRASCTGSSRKSRRTTSIASLASENVDIARLPQARSTATFFSKLSVSILQGKPSIDWPHGRIVLEDHSQRIGLLTARTGRAPYFK